MIPKRISLYTYIFTFTITFLLGVLLETVFSTRDSTLLERAFKLKLVTYHPTKTSNNLVWKNKDIKYIITGVK